ncbi:MAG: hypothetical protein ACOY42_09290 [Pseudomonadota bacterium]
MYTDENYFWGLVGYYLGVLLLLVPAWRLTRPLPGFPLRALVRCALVALLGTPMLAYPDMHYLAPAWGVMLFDAIDPEPHDGLLRGVLPLAAVFGLLYAVTLLAWVPLRDRRRPPARRVRPVRPVRREPRFGPIDRGNSRPGG